jgi:kinesin family protein 2/24
MEKIRVCVRKRPLGIREARRGEINIITVEDQGTLLLHEKKEAVDLTQYILQVRFSFVLETNIIKYVNFLLFV